MSEHLIVTLFSLFLVVCAFALGLIVALRALHAFHGMFG